MRDVFELITALAPDVTDTDKIHLLDYFDAAMSDTAVNAIRTAVELGFCSDDIFYCLMHGVSNASKLLLDALDEWTQTCLQPGEEDRTPAFDDTIPTDSKFSRFLHETFKLFIDTSYHLNCRERFGVWLAEINPEAYRVLLSTPNLLGERFVVVLELLQQLVVL